MVGLIVPKPFQMEDRKDHKLSTTFGSMPSEDQPPAGILK